MKMVPGSLPQQTRFKTWRVLQDAGIKDKVALLGVRGYYLDSMGAVGKNDRGIFDDAIFVISETAHVAFNANVDPSVFREGIASLNNGIWRYKLGIHGYNKPAAKRYQALVQAAPVTVSRDGEKAETGYFGINIHRGGRGTSSLGCQTLVASQWLSFIELVKCELKKADQKVIPYLLIENNPEKNGR